MEKELVMYASEEGQVKVEALYENGATWINMEQMCQLFGENEVIISGLLTSIYAEGELREADAVRRIDGKPYYNINAALAVGFRVRSKKGQQFRVWAMGQLREKIMQE